MEPQTCAAAWAAADAVDAAGNVALEQYESTYRRSVEFGELAGAMVAVQSELKNPKKDQTADIATKSGGKYQYSYADLASVLDSCRETLTKHGIAIFQPLSVDRNAVTVSTLLAHKSGQWICSDLTMTTNDVSAQSIGSIITYARRYGLTAMVGIAGEDDDGAVASAAPRKAERRSEPAPQPAFQAADGDLPPELATAGIQPTPPARRVINESQRRLLKASAREGGFVTPDGDLDNEAIKRVIEKHGFSSSKDITEDKFDTILRVLRGEPEAA